MITEAKHTHYRGVPLLEIVRQRDELAEALRSIAEYDNGFGTLQEFARAALAKLSSGKECLTSLPVPA